MQWGPICITKKGLWWCLFLVFIHANVISMMMIVAIMMMSRIGSVLMMSLGADWESGCAEPQLGNVMWWWQSWGHTPLHHNNNQDDSDGDSNHQLQNVMQPMLPKILSWILYPRHPTKTMMCTRRWFTRSKMLMMTIVMVDCAMQWQQSRLHGLHNASSGRPPWWRSRSARNQRSFQQASLTPSAGNIASHKRLFCQIISAAASVPVSSHRVNTETTENSKLLAVVLLI